MPDHAAPPMAEASIQSCVGAAATAHGNRPDELLPILHAVQDEFGYLPDETVPLIADALNLSRAEVYGVIAFYRDFRTTPPGRTAVRICRAEACQAVGADALIEHARTRLGIGFGQTSTDKAVSLDEVFCLGNCSLGPAAQIDGRLHGRVTPARFDELIDRSATTEGAQ
jgi:formate dehydrogenase subunit gamma